ncbi:hypothetical protein M441DRAFT_230991 [Trichoderma asperellum CBS 433.97]|uniref:Uncharacterized protein n=1 Tax=Trichoderma asperellum (strain ATCC 204424 / CBS 433.97 / NBRC 101777) TaxID=1042311 RepID=A0A2T3ZQK1_TRIA4|nr:hypothetical protein M441DRAFT_230991 [Trichoderma asperellum CBS 433.97]PTB47098.1 hypothetical protein M441DRAFT_230991 [Trichoderma asperellum CBS 433.97]
MLHGGVFVPESDPGSARFRAQRGRSHAQLAWEEDAGAWRTSCSEISSQFYRHHLTGVEHVGWPLGVVATTCLAALVLDCGPFWWRAMRAKRGAES